MRSAWCLPSTHTGSGLDSWQLGVVVHTFNQELGRQTQEDQAGELDHQVKVFVSHAWWRQTVVGREDGPPTTVFWPHMHAKEGPLCLNKCVFFFVFVKEPCHLACNPSSKAVSSREMVNKASLDYTASSYFKRKEMRLGKHIQCWQDPSSSFLGQGW